MKKADIEGRVEAWIRQYAMTAPGERVLVALSGGADSVCLTEILLKLKSSLGISLHAAHYNHHLRGAESDRDEAFVRNYCASRSLPLSLGGGDVAAESARLGLGIEEMARDMRYAFFDQIMTEVGANKVATAHNTNDNTETVMLNQLRGSGIRGLCGIPPVRDRIIRPLLPVERREIEAYLQLAGADYVEDSTNDDTDYRRNRLRHKLIPMMLEHNPDWHQTMLRQSEMLRRDSEYLDDMAEREFQRLIRKQADGYRLNIEGLETMELPMQSRTVTLMLRGLKAPVEERTVRRVLELMRHSNPSARIHVGGGVTVRREYNDLVFVGPGVRQPPPLTATPLPPSGILELPHGALRLHIGEVRGKIHGSFKTFLFKSKAICGKITVRPRMPGDRIRPAGRGVTKTVKKWMIEERIPADIRPQLPVLCDEAGLIAVIPLGVDERVRPAAGDETLTIVVEDISYAQRCGTDPVYPRGSDGQGPGAGGQD